MIITFAALKAYFQTNDVPTQAQFEDLMDTIANGLTEQPKVYKAFISQSGVSAPIETLVVQNTFGSPIVWSYISTGVYRATLAGAFTVGKSVGKCTKVDIAKTHSMHSPLNSFFTLRQSNFSNVLVDTVLAGTFVEITVYP